MNGKCSGIIRLGVVFLICHYLNKSKNGIITVIIQMKSRTKSTRENLVIDSKSRKICDEASKNKKSKKDETQTRKNLMKTLNFLQQNLKLQKMDKKHSNSQLSASVYEIVKNNIPAKQSVFSKSQLQDYTSSMQLAREPIPFSDVNKSTASLLNLSTIQGKRRSNSTLDEYFKQKFGSPARDEQTIEKKLKVLKALKKSQQIVYKANTKAPSGKQNQLLNDFEGKGMIKQKLRIKKTK